MDPFFNLWSRVSTGFGQLCAMHVFLGPSTFSSRLWALCAVLAAFNPLLLLLALLLGVAPLFRTHAAGHSNLLPDQDARLPLWTVPILMCVWLLRPLEEVTPPQNTLGCSVAMIETERMNHAHWVETAD